MFRSKGRGPNACSRTTDMSQKGKKQGRLCEEKKLPRISPEKKTKINPKLLGKRERPKFRPEDVPERRSETGKGKGGGIHRGVGVEEGKGETDGWRGGKRRTGSPGLKRAGGSRRVYGAGCTSLLEGGCGYRRVGKMALKKRRCTGRRNTAFGKRGSPEDTTLGEVLQDATTNRIASGEGFFPGGGGRTSSKGARQSSSMGGGSQRHCQNEKISWQQPVLRGKESFKNGRSLILWEAGGSGGKRSQERRRRRTLISVYSLL